MIVINNGQKLHQHRMGTSKTVKDENGKIVRVNSKELRTKYKNKKDISLDYNQGNSKYERYRIPPKLINDLFDATGL